MGLAKRRKSRLRGLLPFALSAIISLAVFSVVDGYSEDRYMRQFYSPTPVTDSSPFFETDNDPIFAARHVYGPYNETFSGAGVETVFIHARAGAGGAGHLSIGKINETGQEWLIPPLPATIAWQIEINWSSFWISTADEIFFILVPSESFVEASGSPISRSHVLEGQAHHSTVLLNAPPSNVVTYVTLTATLDVTVLVIDWLFNPVMVMELASRHTVEFPPIFYKWGEDRSESNFFIVMAPTNSTFGYEFRATFDQIHDRDNGTAVLISAAIFFFVFFVSRKYLERLATRSRGESNYQEGSPSQKRESRN